ncbi:MAG TPA: FAD-dependent oxidoreductase [Noviherbaspirillum sp.]
MFLKEETALIENSYYEAGVVRASPCARLSEHVSADVCVIGGGYAGLAAALELRARGYAVALLEGQRIGWGASGRNGGQVIVGYAGQAAIEKQLSREEARRAWDISVEAMQWVHDRIAAHGIDCDYTPGFLTLALSPRKARALRQSVEHLEKTYDYRTEWIDEKTMREWVASDKFHGGAYDPLSGHLHPLKYCLGLADAARACGVRMYEDSPVLHVERSGRPLVRTAIGEVDCQFVVLAGNVYLDRYGGGHIAPELTRRIIPVGTYMVATEPMARERADALIRHRAAACDTNFVLDYFRVTADNRLLFGGGDAFSGETPPNLINHVRQRMLAVFPQLADLDVPYAWGGFVDVTVNHAPDFGRIGSNIYYLQGFSGHGLALAGVAGRLVAEAIAGQAERFDLLSRIRHVPLPGGSFIRTPAVALGVLYYKLRDLL